MTLLTLWQRRTELVNQYAKYMKDRRLKDAERVRLKLESVTRQILKMEIRLERRRAA